MNTTLDSHIENLKFRLRLCDRTMSSSNMILAYTRVEELFLYFYRHDLIPNGVNEKTVEKFDKLKNLALGNKNINERRLAFTKSIQAMEKLLGVELL